MAEIKVTCVHPTDKRTATITLDDTMTAGEAIEQLIQNDFMIASPAGYALGKPGANRLPNDKELGAAGVKDGDKLNVIPSTDAGAGS